MNKIKNLIIYGKLGNEIQRQKQRQKKLKENTRLEGQNFFLFVVCYLRKQKTIIGRIFLNLKFKKSMYEYR